MPETPKVIKMLETMALGNQGRAKLVGNNPYIWEAVKRALGPWWVKVRVWMNQEPVASNNTSCLGSAPSAVTCGSREPQQVGERKG